MGYEIISPRNSFVQFDPAPGVPHCIWGDMSQCLPILLDSDVTFQFIVRADSIEEADALCTLNNSLVDIGLVRDCDQDGFDVEFSEQPERFRINEFDVLFNWNWGLTGAVGFYQVRECFFIRVVVNGENHCSNCFQRILSECFSSVLEYGNDEDGFGFYYCDGGSIPTDGPVGDCLPTEIEFISQTSLSIPYTTELQTKYGTIPSVQIWIYDIGGELVNMGIVASFDALPPSLINIDLGGIASGVVRIGI